MPLTPSSFAAAETVTVPSFQEVHLAPQTLFCSAQVAFDFFRNVHNFPRFMQGVDKVELIEPGLIRCSGHLHKHSNDLEEWMVRIVDDERYLVIGWQILDLGVGFDVSGGVAFDEIEPKIHGDRAKTTRGTAATERCLMNSHFVVKGAEAGHTSVDYISQVLTEDARAFRKKAQKGELISPVVTEEAKSRSSIEPKFRELADRWERETGHLFSAQEKLSHPACRQIAGMGQAVVPLVIRDLSQRRGEWLMLLVEMTGLNLGAGKSVEEAQDEWRQWARTFVPAPDQA